MPPIPSQSVGRSRSLPGNLQRRQVGDRHRLGDRVEVGECRLPDRAHRVCPGQRNPDFGRDGEGAGCRGIGVPLAAANATAPRRAIAADRAWAGPHSAAIRSRQLANRLRGSLARARAMMGRSAGGSGVKRGRPLRC